MAELIAIAYTDEDQAARVLEGIKQLDETEVVDLDDAVAVAKDSEGRIRIEGSRSNVRRGAGAGALIGTVIGMIFLAPVAGAIFGAASGALGGEIADVSKVDEFTTQVGDNMRPGSSVIVMRGHGNEPAKLLAMLGQYGGTVIKTSLPDDAEDRIRAALSGAGSGGN
jgi:uncharacterized membrane protein